MDFAPAFLEDWMRWYYFAADTDIGSSGVGDLSLAELRALLGISHDDLDRIVFRDSTSCGGPELRAAVAKRWGNGDPDRVMATHGASEAIYLVMNALLEPGQRVVALDPIYHSLVSTATTLGCEVVPWRLRPEAGFVPDLAELAELVDDRTAMIVVNFPHNPTGATLTPEQQRKLVETADAAGARLVWDTALAELVYDAPPLPDPTSLSPNAISIGTLSKAYGLPGLRFGWCNADPAVLERMVVLRDRMTLHLSPLVEFLATRLAQDTEPVLRPFVERAARNRQTLIGWAAEHAELVDLPVPAGGVTAFPRLIGVEDAEPVCRRLAEERRVLLVPGRAFDHPDRVRLGFGGGSEETAAGLAALGALLAE